MFNSSERPANAPGIASHGAHTFHIPVMGTGFTVDTPLRVARYGISSVVSIGDDVLLEKMRKFYSEKYKREFTEIIPGENDYRARRITAYLNLLDTLVHEHNQALQSSPFEAGSEITRYFRLLPQSALKDEYCRMLETSDPARKEAMQDSLRRSLTFGKIDVNIMTKIDGDRYHNGVKLPPEEATAMSALRGYARSNLDSSIVLSAGMNPRLFSYMAEFPDFLPNERGELKKRIILKVSDFRSALIQGKMLAKKGLWVSEYRIESGINCGGHAFAGKGFLAGPILQEFKNNRQELTQTLFALWRQAIEGMGLQPREVPYSVLLTYQGGIGTADEDLFVRQHYDLDGTGWGTPFLLVPEVTNVDDAHMEKLLKAGVDDVELSDNSPLGVPFWMLKNSDSELMRKKRIEHNQPGSSCPKGFLSFNTEFTKVPICQASRVYQVKKLKEIDRRPETGRDTGILSQAVLKKSCLCMDLAAGVLLKNHLDADSYPAVCCGPNIVHFDSKMTLEGIVDHIYGRVSVIASHKRPHMFITELLLYIDFLKKEIEKFSQGLIERTEKYFAEFRQNLQAGIDYYKNLAAEFNTRKREDFLADLEAAMTSLTQLINGTPIKAPIVNAQA